MNASGAVAGIVSPVAFAWILDRTGSWTLPFAVSVGLLLFAIVMTYWIRPDRLIEAVTRRRRLGRGRRVSPQRECARSWPRSQWRSDAMTTMFRLDRRRFLAQSALAGAAVLVSRRHAWAAGPSDPAAETASGKIRGAGRADGINAFKADPLRRLDRRGRTGSCRRRSRRDGAGCARPSTFRAGPAP